MSIKLECMACGRNLRVKDDMAGRKARCPGCSKVMTVPAVVEELPVVDDDEEVPEVDDEEAPAARPRPRRRRARLPSGGGGMPAWLAPLGLALLLFAIGTACLIIAINSDYYQFLFGCILCWILGAFAIMRMFGWSPY
jgi:hypothetical protein